MVLRLLAHFEIIVEEAHDPLNKLISTILGLNVYNRQVEHVEVVFAKSFYPRVNKNR